VHTTCCKLALESVWHASSSKRKFSLLGYQSQDSHLVTFITSSSYYDSLIVIITGICSQLFSSDCTRSWFGGLDGFDKDIRSGISSPYGVERIGYMLSFGPELQQGFPFLGSKPTKQSISLHPLLVRMLLDPSNHNWW